MRDLGVSRLCAGHDLKARVEVDHGGRELLQDACVTFHLCGSVRDLRVQGLCTHHSLLKIRPIDREGQIGIVGLEPLDIRKRRILQLDQEFLAVVRRDQIDREAHPFGFMTVHANAEEVEE